MNKSIAGYRMLMLLSNVDGEVSKEEGKLIVDYLKKAFPVRVNLDSEIDFLSKLDASEYFFHFGKAMDAFYLDSNQGERAGFVDFAVKMVKADHKITKEENLLLDELLNGWDPDAAE